MSAKMKASERGYDIDVLYAFKHAVPEGRPDAPKGRTRTSSDSAAMQSRNAEKAEILLRKHIEQARKQPRSLMPKTKLDRAKTSNEKKEFN